MFRANIFALRTADPSTSDKAKRKEGHYLTLYWGVWQENFSFGDGGIAEFITVIAADLTELPKIAPKKSPISSIP
jgi:hypothetical protein